MVNMSTEEKIIKTSSRYWRQEIGAIVLVSIVLPVAMILYFGEKMYAIGGLGLLVGIPCLISEVRAARRQKITFTKSALVIKVTKDDIKQPWEAIKAAKLTGHGRSRLLVLYCDEHNLNIPCKFFDESEFMERLKEHLSPTVLHPQAYQGLPQFVEWQGNITKKLSNLNRPLKVSLGRSEKRIGLFGVGLGVLFAILYFFNTIEPVAALVLSGLFGGLGLFLLLSCVGWIEGDNESISIRTLFRKVIFSWNELREIHINSDRGVLALVGDNGRLIIPNSSSWSGKDKELLLQLLHLKVEMSRLEPMESGKPLYWRSKNA
jgi:hypothetical protein